MNELKKQALYVVATPIGNLSDISSRALETLRNVDFIAAEDTRVTAKMLSAFGIKNSLVSYHAHNIREKTSLIIERLKAGENCAIVTDAGTPCVSDPGEELVKACCEHQLSVYAVAGASAVIAALSISGMDTKRFLFEGFLSVSKKQRTLRLSALKSLPYTIIFYEAPHKLKNTLNDLFEHFGDRKIALCRELTKIHEEVLRGKLSELIDFYNEKAPRGEYVLIVEGANLNANADLNEEALTLEEAANLALKLNESESGISLSEAAKTVSQSASNQTGLKKSEIYRLAAKIKNNE